jgi:hypothetical protein
LEHNSVGAVVLHAGLTQHNTRCIERVQKCAFSIILGENYNCYEYSLIILNMEKLSDRRVSPSLRSAKKASIHPKHNNWFVRCDTVTNTRMLKPTYKPVQTRTERFKRSAQPYLTSLLNEDSTKK